MRLPSNTPTHYTDSEKIRARKAPGNSITQLDYKGSEPWECLLLWESWGGLALSLRFGERGNVAGAWYFLSTLSACVPVASGWRRFGTYCTSSELGFGISSSPAVQLQACNRLPWVVVRKHLEEHSINFCHDLQNSVFSSISGSLTHQNENNVFTNNILYRGNLWKVYLLQSSILWI